MFEKIVIKYVELIVLCACVCIEEAKFYSDFTQMVCQWKIYNFPIYNSIHIDSYIQNIQVKLTFSEIASPVAFSPIIYITI